MKRDLDLIRLILLEVEKQEELIGSDSIRIHGFDSKETLFNIGLLVEAGYLDAPSIHNGMYGERSYAIKAITYKGFDYLDAVRKPKVWQKVKDNASHLGLSLTMDLAKDAAIAISRHLLNVATA